MNKLFRALAIALAFFPSLAAAQSFGSSVIFPSGYAPGMSFCVKQADGTCAPVSTTNPLPVTGGGGGDASAANQSSQITLAQSIRDEIGAVSGTPATNTLQARLEALRVLLGTPFQAGGSIANTAFGISGNLPAFATNPTVRFDQSAGANGVIATGNIASGTADSGNPVKFGCMYSLTQPTFTDGNRANCQSDSKGNLRVSVASQNLNTNQVALSTTATLIAAARPGRQKLIITGTAATVFYVGGASVTATTGGYVPAGGSVTLDTNAAVYGILPTGTLTVTFIELY